MMGNTEIYTTDRDILVDGFSGDPQKVREGRMYPQLIKILDVKDDGEFSYGMSSYDMSIAVDKYIQQLPYDLDNKPLIEKKASSPFNKMLEIAGQEEHSFRNNFKLAHVIYNSALDTLTLFLQDKTVILLATSQMSTDSKLKMIFRKSDGRIGSIERDNRGAWNDITTKPSINKESLWSEFESMEKLKDKYSRIEN